MTKLTQFRLDSLKTEGLYSDPETTGLYVQVTNRRGKREGITKSWVYRYVSPIHKKSRCMGLGPCKVIDIPQARQLAIDARKWVTLGVDPIDRRNDKIEQDRQAAIQERASTVTFAHCVKQFLADKTRSFKSAKHARQYRKSLERACAAFGELNVWAIDAPAVIKFLTPMWREIPVTAKRLQGRIESVLDWAAVHQFREGENPARWNGHLEHVFSAPTKQESHAAIPVDAIPAFMARLRQLDGLPARALEFCALTAVRSDNARKARWADIDLAKKMWTIPGSNMKMKETHFVPLSDAAVALLESLDKSGNPTFVFGTGKMDDKRITKPLRQAHDGPSTVPGRPATVNGLRSSFSNWTHAQGFSHEAIELCLAHAVGNKVSQTYWKERNVKECPLIMQAWGSYCAAKPEADNVYPLRA
jgi:integrase